LGYRVQAVSDLSTTDLLVVLSSSELGVPETLAIPLEAHAVGAMAS
jgi:hypothetical protein